MLSIRPTAGGSLSRKTAATPDSWQSMGDDFRQPLRFLHWQMTPELERLRVVDARERWSGGDCNLVVCPALGGSGGQDELFQKFHLPFEILTNDRIEVQPGQAMPYGNPLSLCVWTS